jgi:hypothetical protein
MVAAASAILFRVNWRCLNQIFYVRRIFNSHSGHVWPEANPLATSVHYHQQRFVANVSAGIVHDFLNWPYLLPRQHRAQIYRVFVEEKLVEMLEEIPLAFRRNM